MHLSDERCHIKNEYRSKLSAIYIENIKSVLNPSV